MQQNKIAIFASGRGSNAKKIIEYFEARPQVEIALIVSNKPNAPVLELGTHFGISTLLLKRKSFYKTRHLLDDLAQFEINFVVLAGFLWFIPDYLTTAFEGRMINIHPSLLPKYGGKGMYGMKVHEAVYENRELETGMTIHYVNEQYDEGQIVFQAKCAVHESDTPALIAQKVQQLEHYHFPRVIEQLLLNSTLAF